jgi:hypothetical protein
MKFAVGTGGWPIGQFCVPTGTIIDTSSMDPGMTTLLAKALAPGKVPPMNSQALDQETYAAMVAAYGYHRVFYGPGIKPEVGPRPSILKSTRA